MTICTVTSFFLGRTKWPLFDVVVIDCVRIVGASEIFIQLQSCRLIQRTGDVGRVRCKSNLIRIETGYDGDAKGRRR